MILQAKLNNHMSTHTNALAAAAAAVATTGQNRDQLVVQAMDRGRFVAAAGVPPPPTVAKIEQFVEQPKFVTVDQKQFTVNT